MLGWVSGETGHLSARGGDGIIYGSLSDRYPKLAAGTGLRPRGTPQLSSADCLDVTQGPSPPHSYCALGLCPQVEPGYVCPGRNTGRADWVKGKEVGRTWTVLSLWVWEGPKTPGSPEFCIILGRMGCHFLSSSGG